MLKNKIIAQAAEHQQALDQRDGGLVIIARPGSLLHAVVTAGTQITSTTDTTNTTAEIIHADSKLNVNGTYVHDVALRGFKEKVRNSIHATVAASRDVVMPMIRDVFAIYEDVLSRDVKKAEQICMVVSHTPPTYLNRPEVKALVDEWSEAPVQDDVSIPFPKQLPFNVVDIRQLAQSGVPSLDKIVNGAMDDLPEGHLEDLFDRVFNQGQYIGGRLDTYMPTNEIDAVDTFIIAMICKSMVENVGAFEGKDISLDELRLVAAKGYRGCMLSLSQYERTREVSVRVGSLLLAKTVINDVPALHLDGDVYAEYLKKGGSVEAVMGKYAMRKTDDIKPADLLENHAAYEKCYERTKNTRAHTETIMLDAKRDGAMVTALAIYLDDLDDERLDKTTFLRNFKQQIALFSKADLKAETKCLTTALSKALFPNQMVCEYLEIADSIASMDSELSAEQCAALAQAELLGMWLAKQVIVSNSGE